MNSKYKIWGGFGLLIKLNLLIGFGTFKLLTSSKISLDKVDLINDNNARFAYIIIIGIQLLFIILFMTQCRQIKVDIDKIKFTNPIIPFLSKTIYWNKIDYYTIVEERSRYDTYEAVWLVKNNKLIGRFSSFYYTNYLDLKGQIKAKGIGRSRINSFRQFFILLGILKVK